MDPKSITPQWRVLKEDIPNKLGDRWSKYRIGFCDVASPRDRRSFVAALIPPNVICGDKVPTIDFPEGFEWFYLPWLAVANSFVVDWLTRSRLSSAKLSFTVMDGLPLPRYPLDHPIVKRVAPVVLRLTCTSIEMTDYWNAMAAYGWCEPVPVGTVPAEAFIDAEQRAVARAELDVIVAKHVYGLSQEELSYVLGQFPVLERWERKKYGSYVTKERILDQFSNRGVRSSGALH